MALVRSIAELDEVRRPLALPAATRIRRCTYRRLIAVTAGVFDGIALKSTTRPRAFVCTPV